MAIDDVVSMDDALTQIQRIMGGKAVDYTKSPSVLKKIRVSPANVDVLYLTVKKMLRGLPKGNLKSYFKDYAKDVEDAYVKGQMQAFLQSMRNFAISIYAD